MNETEFVDWVPVEVPDEQRRKLVRQIMRGRIIRADFPELWPPTKKITIKVNLPDDKD